MNIHNRNKYSKLTPSINNTGHEKIVELLIENGADVNIVNNDKNTALILAVNQGSY